MKIKLARIDEGEFHFTYSDERWLCLQGLDREKGENVYLFKRECFSRHTTSTSTLVTARSSPVKHSNLAAVNQSSKAPNAHKHMWAVL